MPPRRTKLTRLSTIPSSSSTSGDSSPVVGSPATVQQWLKEISPDAQQASRSGDDEDPSRRMRSLVPRMSHAHTLTVHTQRLQALCYVLAEVSCASTLLDEWTRAVNNIPARLATSWKSAVAVVTKQAELRRVMGLINFVARGHPASVSGLSGQRPRERRQRALRHELLACRAEYHELHVSFARHVEGLRRLLLGLILQQYLHISVEHCGDDALLHAGTHGGWNQSRWEQRRSLRPMPASHRPAKPPQPSESAAKLLSMANPPIVRQYIRRPDRDIPQRRLMLGRGRHGTHGGSASSNTSTSSDHGVRVGGEDDGVGGQKRSRPATNSAVSDALHASSTSSTASSSSSSDDGNDEAKAELSGLPMPLLMFMQAASTSQPTRCAISALTRCTIQSLDVRGNDLENAAAMGSPNGIMEATGTGVYSVSVSPRADGPCSHASLCFGNIQFIFSEVKGQEEPSSAGTTPRGGHASTTSPCTSPRRAPPVPAVMGSEAFVWGEDTNCHGPMEGEEEEELPYFIMNAFSCSEAEEGDVAEECLTLTMAPSPEPDWKEGVEIGEDNRAIDRTRTGSSWGRVDAHLNDLDSSIYVGALPTPSAEPTSEVQSVMPSAGDVAFAEELCARLQMWCLRGQPRSSFLWCADAMRSPAANEDDDGMQHTTLEICRPLHLLSGYMGEITVIFREECAPDHPSHRAGWELLRRAMDSCTEVVICAVRESRTHQGQHDGVHEDGAAAESGRAGPSFSAQETLSTAERDRPFLFERYGCGDVMAEVHWSQGEDSPSQESAQSDKISISSTSRRPMADADQQSLRVERLKNEFRVARSERVDVLLLHAPRGKPIATATLVPCTIPRPNSGKGETAREAVQMTVFKVLSVSPYVAPLLQHLRDEKVVLVDLDRTLVDNAIHCTSWDERELRARAEHVPSTTSIPAHAKESLTQSLVNLLLERTCTQEATLHTRRFEEIKKVTYTVRSSSHTTQPILRSEIIFVRPGIRQCLHESVVQWGIPLLLVTKSTKERTEAILEQVLDPHHLLFPSRRSQVITTEQLERLMPPNLAPAEGVVVACKSAVAVVRRFNGDVYRHRSCILGPHSQTLLGQITRLRGHALGKARSVAVVDDAPQVWLQDDWPCTVAVAPYTMTRLDPESYLSSRYGWLGAHLLGSLFSSRCVVCPQATAAARMKISSHCICQCRTACLAIGPWGRHPSPPECGEQRPSRAPHIGSAMELILADDEGTLEGPRKPTTPLLLYSPRMPSAKESLMNGTTTPMTVIACGEVEEDDDYAWGDTSSVRNDAIATITPEGGPTARQSRSANLTGEVEVEDVVPL